jgi:hypothetical protein
MMWYEVAYLRSKNQDPNQPNTRLRAFNESNCMGRKKQGFVTLDMCRAAYLREILAAHPDKGGSQSRFEEVQSAFKYLTTPENIPSQAAAISDACGNDMEPLHGARGVVMDPGAFLTSLDVSHVPEQDFAQQHLETAHAAFEAGQNALAAGKHILFKTRRLNYVCFVLDRQFFCGELGFLVWCSRLCVYGRITHSTPPPSSPKKKGE